MTEEVMQDSNWEVLADPQAFRQGVDLLEEFMNEFETGSLGDDRKIAMAMFLHTRGLNSNPETIDGSL